MLDRIENTRRLKEQCERRARQLRAIGESQAGWDMERQAQRLGDEIRSLEAAQALASFAARVEE